MKFNRNYCIGILFVITVLCGIVLILLASSPFTFFNFLVDNVKIIWDKEIDLITYFNYGYILFIVSFGVFCGFTGLIFTMIFDIYSNKRYNSDMLFIIALLLHYCNAFLVDNFVVAFLVVTAIIFVCLIVGIIPILRHSSPITT